MVSCLNYLVVMGVDFFKWFSEIMDKLTSLITKLFNRQQNQQANRNSNIEVSGNDNNVAGRDLTVIKNDNNGEGFKAWYLGVWALESLIIALLLIYCFSYNNTLSFENLKELFLIILGAFLRIYVEILMISLIWFSLNLCSRSETKHPILYWYFYPIIAVIRITIMSLKLSFRILLFFLDIFSRWY